MTKRKYDFDRDEGFDIICFYMGQGDCSLIRCPDGTLIMIDCGSTNDFLELYENIVQKQVRDTKWTGKSTIDALILTHNDKDHYQNVIRVLGATNADPKKPNKLKIERIYFSGASEDTSPLGNYTQSGFNNTVYNHYFSTSELYEVTINSEEDDDNYYKKWAKSDSFKTLQEQVTIPDREMILFNGETPSGEEWKVSLIAGNVQKAKDLSALGVDKNGNVYKDGATADNAQSLVTLLEIGTRKALFCGDATFSTENFLVEHQSAFIQNATFVPAPHHGSEWASSEPFVNVVKAQQVVVSTAYMEHSFLHPRQTIIESWQEVSGALATTHYIDYWAPDPVAAIDMAKEWQKQKLAALQSPSGNFTWLEEIPDGSPVCYGISRGRALLYRMETKDEIQETAFSIDPNDTTNLKQFLNFQITPKTK